jgi:hypothetical protein
MVTETAGHLFNAIAWSVPSEIRNRAHFLSKIWSQCANSHISGFIVSLFGKTCSLSAAAGMGEPRPEASSGSSPPHRSKICAVCKCESENFHLNYGVGTCNSCRAFFRRCVQSDTFLDGQGKFVNSMCLTGGRCEMSEATRKRCRWCRFTACKEAGMNAGGVLQGC